MSSVTEVPPGAAPDDLELTATPPRAAGRAQDVILALVVAAALVAVAFISSGVDQTAATPGNTWTEIALTLLGTAGATLALVRSRDAPRWGAVTVLMLALFTALQAISVLWSVLPDSTWLASGQALCYLAVFAAAVTGARLAPTRWPALLGGLALAATVVCARSLLAKVFPLTLAAGNEFGRLQAPFGYWNALGLAAAIGLPVCLWLGSRRGRSVWVGALAVPAISLMVAVLVLSYSRSADLAAVVGLVLWFALVPVRLRAALVMAAGCLGGAVISVWSLAHHALSGDGVRPALQDSAGHIFGIVLLIVIVATALGGLWLAAAIDTRAVTARSRRRWATALLCGVALVPVVVVIAVALSPRGLFGEISHGWDELTSTTSVSTNTAGRVLNVGSSRPLYWHEAISVGDHALLKGVGALGFAAARLRYSTDGSVVQQAHSFVFETFADLGILGLLVAAGLLLAWCVSAARPLVRGRWRTLPAAVRGEREAMLTLAVVVVTFGVQSTLDWTWYFPGVAVPALLAAGWLSGRGPLVLGTRAARPGATVARGRSILDRPVAAMATLLLIAAALAGAWMTWRPLRSAQDLTAAENGNGSQVLSDARAAEHADPLSLYPHELLSDLYLSLHEKTAARNQLLEVTRRQPDNPSAWLALGQLDYRTNNLLDAKAEAAKVLALDTDKDTTGDEGENLLIQAASLYSDETGVPAG